MDLGWFFTFLLWHRVDSRSPELLADDTRDYSIYYADPLETVDILNHVDTPGNHSSTIPHKGISVGVGLLSWWLSDSAEERLLESRTGDDDENLVVGRITNDRGTKTLEIIMSFKEVSSDKVLLGLLIPFFTDAL